MLPYREIRDPRREQMMSQKNKRELMLYHFLVSWVDLRIIAAGMADACLGIARYSDFCDPAKI